MIINSLLDTDFYKFTMAQAVLHNYPSVWVKYRFKNRKGSTVPEGCSPSNFLNRLNEEVDNLCDLRFSREELSYLKNIPYLTRDFIEHLSLLKLNRKYIKCSLNNKKEIEIVIEGPWISTIWFEVPVLAIVSELYGELGLQNITYYIEGNKRLNNKIGQINRGGSFIKFADFGTRRRYSFYWQSVILEDIKNEFELTDNFIGTSNVLFAKELDLKLIGTMAHEWLMAHQQLNVKVKDSQKQALEVWAKEFRGELGIALSDTLGFDYFLKDFDRYFAKLFDGCRHDSGDPYEWCEKLLRHYEKLGIDSKTKQAVFSDGLNFKKALELHDTYNRFINCSFGIGTNLTNDVGIKPLNIVIKMVECNGEPVAKISDNKGKGMCEDKNYLEYIKSIIEKEN